MPIEFIESGAAFAPVIGRRNMDIVFVGIKIYKNFLSQMACRINPVVNLPGSCDVIVRFY
jgi:hypothetical protein